MTLFGLMTVSSGAQRVTDKLNRGLVAIPQGDKTGQDSRYGTTGSGIFVSWRILPTEYYDTKYNLYRDGTKIASDLSASNYQDDGGKSTSTYTVIPVVKGTERTELASEAVKPWAHQYWDIPVMAVVGRDGAVASNYSLNDCSVADVDGDGQMEFVVKRRNDSGDLRLASNKTNFNLHECYKMDGTRLWWIDMGPNLMSGPDEQFDLILYDWDQDGKAEAVMRGADNMIIHTATGKTINIGDMTAGFSGGARPEYMGVGKEYLLYLDGETGEPYGWDGSENWTPMDYPLPQFESNESYGSSDIWGDLGHRMQKHYFGAPYLDGRNPSIFLGRGCYTRHKFCALDVNPETHELTQRWRWNCYDGNSPWFGQGFHNYAIADVDMDGRDEIIFGSMIIDDTGYGLATTGFGHGDAQHCGDLDPYTWGLEQFVCLEGLTVPGMALTDATTQTVRYSSGTGGDNGRCMAGNFQSVYPGAVARSAGGGLVSVVGNKVIEGDSHMANDDYWNMRIYWDGDLLDEFMDSPGVERAPTVYKYGGQTEVGTGRAVYPNDRVFMGEGQLNNSSKNNPGFLGDIIGDWREEIVVRNGTAGLRIYTTSYPSEHGITTLWADHQYRNAMAWQSVGYNQPPHPSFFLGELEGITNCPPALTLEGRTEVQNGGTITTTDGQLLVSGYEDKTISVADGASPWVLTVNAPAWVQGTGAQQAVASTPKQPVPNVITYTTTLTGGAFDGDMHLVKQGEGVLVLPDVVEKHTGATEIWNGTLQFDGTMESSAVWLNRHTSLVSNGGKFLAGLKADYNAAIYPGGKGSVGSITVSQLDLGFGARIVMDVDGENVDQLNISKLTIESKADNSVWKEYGPKYKTPVMEFVGVSGDIAAGKYLLGTVGEVTGSIESIQLEGLGEKRAMLEYTDGQLYLVLEDLRAATTVVWNGTASSNVWDFGVTKNFLNNGVADYAGLGDDVVFGDDAENTTVNIKGGVKPNSIVFNNDVKAYTIVGDSIVGGAPITKNGKGKVTINTENRTGATTINEGTVEVNLLANTAGQDYGSLGDASQTITINDGAVLLANGTIKTDHPFNITGSATINVPSGKDLIINNSIRGTGAVLIKTGMGSMQTGLNNTYKKLIVKQGSVTSQENSSAVQQVPDTIEFQGGTFYDFGNENTYSSNKAHFVVPAGQTGTFYGDPRCDYTGTLTGSGTFNVYGTWVRCYYKGDWSKFEGTVVPGLQDRSVKHGYDPSFDLQNAKGLPKATLKLNDKVVCNTSYNIEVGSVTGTGTLAGTGYIIGVNNKDMLASFKSTAPITKRGTGYLQVSGIGYLSNSVTVEEGELRFNDTQLKTNYFGAVTAKGTGIINGRGLLPSLTMESGTQVTPRSMYVTSFIPGTIKVAAAANIKSGATLEMLVKTASDYSKLEARFLTINGTVKVTFDEAYVPKAGDSFTLWTTTGSFTGTPVLDLPELPAGLYWNTSALAAATGVLSITDSSADGIGRIADSEQVACEVYTTGGMLAGTFKSLRSDVRTEVEKLGVKPGLYVVRMMAGRNIESQTVVVK